MLIASELRLVRRVCGRSYGLPVLGGEDGVGQGDRADVLELGLIVEGGVDVEDDRRLDALARLQGRLREAEALDLDEVAADLRRLDVERGNAGRGAAARIADPVEDGLGLAEPG